MVGTLYSPVRRVMAFAWLGLVFEPTLRQESQLPLELRQDLSQSAAG